MARKPKLGSIYQRGGVWWLKYHRNGRPYRESSGSALYADAERLLKRRMGEMVSGKFAGLAIERIRMQDLFDDLVEEDRINQRASIVASAFPTQAALGSGLWFHPGGRVLHYPGQGLRSCGARVEAGHAK